MSSSSNPALTQGKNSSDNVWLVPEEHNLSLFFNSRPGWYAAIVSGIVLAAVFCLCVAAFIWVFPETKGTVITASSDESA
jgi:hypothetical protein